MELGLPIQLRPLTLTKEKTNLIWQKFNEYPVTDDPLRGDFVWFMSTITSPESIWLEYHDHGEWVGLMWFDRIQVGHMCEVHIFFWDRRLKGREPVLLEMGKWAFDFLRLERVGTQVPSFAKATINFILRLGFVEEGRIRKGYKHNGELYDFVYFGLLKKELKNGWIKINERTEQGTTSDHESVGAATNATGDATPRTVQGAIHNGSSSLDSGSDSTVSEQCDIGVRPDSSENA